MREYFQSKNFLITLIAGGCVFILIVIVQFASIVSLNTKQKELNLKLNNLAGQEQYYEGLYDEASGENFAEGFAKEEGNMKNKDESVYKGE